MNNIYDTKEQALQKAEEINLKAETTKYCPLLQDICKKNCVCFKEAFVHTNFNGKFEVLGFCCDNYMLLGQ